MRGTIVVVVLGALTVAGPRLARAQALVDTTATTPGAEHAAGELLQVMHLDAQWPGMISAQLDQMVVAQPAMAPFRSTMTDFFEKYAGWQTMAPAMQHLYAQEFTEPELHDLIVFYRTPTGQKALSKLALLQSRGAAIGQQVVAEHRDELTAAITLRAEQIRDSADSSQPAPNNAPLTPNPPGHRWP
jgi:hypothetical protein